MGANDGVILAKKNSPGCSMISFILKPLWFQIDGRRHQLQAVGQAVQAFRMADDEVAPFFKRGTRRCSTCPLVSRLK